MSLDTPWERAKRRQYETHEFSLASKPGAQKQLNSGRTWNSKRDIIFRGFLFEARTKEQGKTSEFTHTIDVRELQKLSRDAVFHNALPGMNFEWPDFHERWVFIREKDFEDITSAVSIARAEVEELEREVVYLKSFLEEVEEE